MGRLRAAAGRNSIRRQLTRNVLIPSVSFLLLWAIIAAAGSGQTAALALATLNGSDGVASLGAVAAELRHERRATQVFLGDTDRKAASALDHQRASTDEAFRAAYEQASRLLDRGDPEIRHRTRDFFENWKTLPALRGSVSAGRLDRETALVRYTDLINDIHLISDAIVMRLNDERSLTEGVLALQLMRARDYYSQADALLSGVIAAGAMTYEESAHFVHLTASYRDVLRDSEHHMAPAVRAHYDTMRTDDHWITVTRLSQAVVMREPVNGDGTTGRPAGWNTEVPVGLREWETAAAAAAPLFHDVVIAQIQSSIDSAWVAVRHRILVNVGGCLAAFVAGVTAIVVALRSARRLTGRLQRLRADTLEVADTRLPDIVSRAQNGGRVDVEAELPPLSYGQDEIGEVADAFNTAQRTAVRAAVKQAEIREGANRVFLGIAYRNQALVQRQLRLLDEIEYEEEDPRRLQKLFRLDHLATRGRRYADNLIILSGAPSARRWREHLPLVDVLRAAISETEDYQRVRLKSAPKAWVHGVAVADVVHLVAELVENATQFSPAGAPVDVNSGQVPGGLAIDVEDRGLGMSEEAYAEANRTLADAPEFDVMALPDEPRLGLFVVARLAARHGVRVRLCPSPYGGTRATAVLPDALLRDVPPAHEEVRELVPRQLGGADGATGSGECPGDR
ncbi:nitrate- and nitrite sensing domain-containing protein [Marinactinospora rubrisoli]|uniref:histidine kinase n=1 Tax=Marinactinospora rubrisoli TaxID=2715399 RepID=A0ABW2KPE7_9ACTN